MPNKLESETVIAEYDGKSIDSVHSPYGHLSDREILEAIFTSQLNTEMLVRNVMEQLGPTVEAFSKGGLMGLLGGGGLRR